MKTIILKDKVSEDVSKPRALGHFTYPNSESPHQSNTFYDTKAVSPTLDTCEGGNRQVKILVENKVDPENINVIGNYMPSNHDASRIVHPGGVAPTVKENHGTVTATIQKVDIPQTVKVRKYACTGATDGYRIRKLTPRECWRLMGFDDTDFDKAEKVCSNTQLYKQAGNSIVVNVLEGILGNLLPKKSRSEWLDELLAGD